VRDEIVEDHAIARVFKEKGYKILVADGKTLYRVRMYTDLESMWQGWTKNLYSLIDSKVGNLLFILVLLNFVLIAPFVQCLIVLNLWCQGDISPYVLNCTYLAVAQIAIQILWYIRTADHRTGVAWYNFFLLPLGGLAVTCLYIHAAYLVLSGSKVSWKGRQYTVNTSKTIQPVITASLDPALDAASGRAREAKD
jgi:hypothetical protein